MTRYLVIANQTLGGRRLLDRVEELCAEGECSFHVLVPATEPRDHVHRVEADSGADLARRRLEDALARFREVGAQVSGEVGPASPLEAVRGALEGGDYQGVLVSTLPAGFSRWLRMDLPSRIARETDIPVEHLESLTELPGGRLGGVAVGIDGSPASTAALRWAAEEARLRGLDLVAVHVFSYVAETTVAAPDVPFAFAGPPYEEVEAEAHELLDGALDEIDLGYVTVTRHVIEGSAAEMLLRAAAGADLLVVGTRGTGGVARIGSVSRDISERAPCPLVIVPPPS